MVLFLSLDEYQGFHNRSQIRMDKIKMSMLSSSNEFHFDGKSKSNVHITNFWGYLQTLHIALHSLVTTHERLLFSFHGKRENIFTHSLHGILIKESKESAMKCRQAVYRCAKRKINSIILKTSISITTIFEWVMDSINCLWLYMYFKFGTIF